MPEPLLLKSADSAAVLEFANASGVYFDVALSAPHFRGATRVYNEPFGRSPAHFFRELVEKLPGSKEETGWGSLDGEFSLEAISDLTGHTTVRVMIQENTGEVWRVEGYLILEAGQLETIARAVEKFFGSA